MSIALGLADAGADIVVNYAENKMTAEEVVNKIQSFGGRAISIQADVSREDDTARLFESARKHFGTLHVVVCNAGIQLDAPLQDMTLEQWNRVLEVNLTGQFLCMRGAAREFLRRGACTKAPSLGSILSISSVHQRIPWSGHANYAASKGAVMMLVRSVAKELAPHGIRVNAISPGAIRTDINKPAWDTENAYRELCRVIPSGRVGEPDEVGRLAAWLCSADASYITGANIVIDGGLTLNLCGDAV